MGWYDGGLDWGKCPTMTELCRLVNYDVPSRCRCIFVKCKVVLDLMDNDEQ